MAQLDDQYLEVIRALIVELQGKSLVWASTGSTSFALQDIPLDPDDREWCPSY
jgi:hypothetical protein